MKANLTITIEGGMGAGKTSMAARLAALLTAEGHEVIVTDDGLRTNPTRDEKFRRPGVFAIRTVNVAARDEVEEALIRFASDLGGDLKIASTGLMGLPYFRIYDRTRLGRQLGRYCQGVIVDGHGREFRMRRLRQQRGVSYVFEFLRRPHTEVAALKTCEIFLDDGKLVAFAPARYGWKERIELKAESFTAANSEVRELGFEPSWA